MPANDNAATLRSATLCLLNAERAKRGLAPLTANAQLGKAAQNHSRAMVRERFFDHISPGGSTLLSRVRRGTGYLRGARSYALGENIAWGSGDYATPQRDRQGLDGVRRPSPEHPQPPLPPHRRRRRRSARPRTPGHARRDVHDGLRTALARSTTPTTRRTARDATRLSRRCRPSSRSEPSTTTPPSPARCSSSPRRPTTSSTPSSAPSSRQRSPYNVVAIDLPEDPDGGDRYDHAAKLLERLARRRRGRPRRRARDLGARPGLHRAPTAAASRATASSRACASRTTAPARSARTSARIPARRPTA